MSAETRFLQALGLHVLSRRLAAGAWMELGETAIRPPIAPLGAREPSYVPPLPSGSLAAPVARTLAAGGAWRGAASDVRACASLVLPSWLVAAQSVGLIGSSSGSSPEADRLGNTIAKALRRWRHRNKGLSGSGPSAQAAAARDAEAIAGQNGGHLLSLSPERSLDASTGLPTSAWQRAVLALQPKMEVWADEALREGSPLVQLTHAADVVPAADMPGDRAGQVSVWLPPGCSSRKLRAAAGAIDGGHRVLQWIIEPRQRDVDQLRASLAAHSERIHRKLDAKYATNLREASKIGAASAASSAPPRRRSSATRSKAKLQAGWSPRLDGANESDRVLWRFLSLDAAGTPPTGGEADMAACLRLGQERRSMLLPMAAAALLPPVPGVSGSAVQLATDVLVERMGPNDVPARGSGAIGGGAEAGTLHQQQQQREAARNGGSKQTWASSLAGFFGLGGGKDSGTRAGAVSTDIQLRAVGEHATFGMEPTRRHSGTGSPRPAPAAAPQHLPIQSSSVPGSRLVGGAPGAAVAMTHDGVQAGAADDSLIVYDDSAPPRSASASLDGAMHDGAAGGVGPDLQLGLQLGFAPTTMPSHSSQKVTEAVARCMRLVGWINEALGVVPLSECAPMHVFLGMERRPRSSLYPEGAPIPAPVVIAAGRGGSGRGGDSSNGRSGVVAGSSVVAKHGAESQVDLHGSVGDVLSTPKIVVRSGPPYTGLQPGDILLFKTASFAAAVQRQATGSLWDHVAMVVPPPPAPPALSQGSERPPRARGRPSSPGRAGELYMTEVTGEGVGTYPLGYRLSLYARSGLAEYVGVRRLRYVRPGGVL